ncbi:MULTISPECIES: DNA polymerase III subunit psi [unclassified Arcicella]|uniref:DNA polymerase III subunit psi n=1 Tax=unclassified Arcicella TaxID=2644986 RepID=UPI0028673538|nr:MULTISPECIES: DNA polymerase III subunit psi [unclassified Arcicella]MDR6560876.1 DNA polymerase III psi subunit [Arcicella sp. BE51]MDR6810760.1 DNA polymerase III psi subunit [Arcicella sp. BE140]MDR6822110.1 DNA polymerase III psi subunit [Arcicella sp. BE139]
MPENNTILFQQLFAGEQLYVIPEQSLQKEKITVENSPIATPIEEKTVMKATATVDEVKVLHFVPNHRIVILVDEYSEADQALLAKILTAVKLNLNQIDLVHLADLSQMNARTAFSQNLISHFITFGVALQKIKLEIPLNPYQTKEIKNIRFLFSHALSELQHDVEKKKALWKALQEMFL